MSMAENKLAGALHHFIRGSTFFQISFNEFFFIQSSVKNIFRWIKQHVVEWVRVSINWQESFIIGSASTFAGGLTLKIWDYLSTAWSVKVAR